VTTKPQGQTKHASELPSSEALIRFAEGKCDLLQVDPDGQSARWMTFLNGLKQQIADAFCIPTRLL